MSRGPSECSNLLFLTCFKGSWGRGIRQAPGSEWGHWALWGCGLDMAEARKAKGSVATRPPKLQGGPGRAVTPTITQQMWPRVLPRPARVKSSTHTNKFQCKTPAPSVLPQSPSQRLGVKGSQKYARPCPQGQAQRGQWHLHPALLGPAVSRSLPLTSQGLSLLDSRRRRCPPFM